MTTPAERAIPGRLGASVIVLAGGRSSRFGSPKLEAALEGRPILGHVLDLARSLSDDVVVTLPPEASERAGAGRLESIPAGVRTVRDSEAFGGPLVALASALEAVDRSIAVVLGGDMPRLSVAIVEPMVIVLGSDARVDAVVLESGGAPRPLPLVVRTLPAREAARAILDGSGERSLRGLVGAMRSHVIDESRWRALDPTGDALADVDRPSDLAALEGRDRKD